MQVRSDSTFNSTIGNINTLFKVHNVIFKVQNRSLVLKNKFKIQFGFKKFAKYLNSICF